MKLNLKSMRESPRERFPFRETEQWEKLEHRGRFLAYTEQVSMQGDATYGSEAVHVNVRLSTEIRQECSRCLKSLPTHIELSESVKLFEEPEGGFDGAPIEGFGYAFGTEILDLNPYLERLIAASLDTKPLCRPDCRGICPECGRDLNLAACRCAERRSVDPRLEKLKELLA